MNKSIPRISVITLTYRKFEKLYDTISSVLSQNYENIEYIICDDGSESFPYDSVKDFVVNNNQNNILVKILQNPINLGTVKSSNLAYKEAVGKYILNLSCGDIFFTDDAVTKIVNRFEDTNANVLVTSRLFYENDFQPICFLPHYEEREILKKLDKPIKQYKAFILSRYYDMASGSAMYFRNDAIKRYNYFDEKYRLWEDGPFLAKYLWNEKLVMAYDIVSIWYEKGGMSTNVNNPSRKMLINDNALFCLGEMLEHFNCFSEKEKKFLMFSNKKCKVKSKWGLWYQRFRFYPQAISNIIYRMQRKLFKYRDFRYISEVLEKNREHILPKKLR